MPLLDRNERDLRVLDQPSKHVGAGYPRAPPVRRKQQPSLLQLLLTNSVDLHFVSRNNSHEGGTQQRAAAFRTSARWKGQAPGSFCERACSETNSAREAALFSLP